MSLSWSSGIVTPVGANLLGSRKGDHQVKEGLLYVRQRASAEVKLNKSLFASSLS
nr:MAG: hypothetical protein H2Rhizo321054_000001 [Mitovirus sp.]